MKKMKNAIFGYLRQVDHWLLAVVFALSAGGAVLVYSATRYISATKMIYTQIFAIVLGMVLMIIVSKIDYVSVAKLWKFIAAAAVILLILTIFHGSGRDGVDEKAWIKIMGYSIQPSEIVKVAFIVTLSRHLEIVGENINRPVNVLLLTAHAAVPLAFIVRQGDFGMTLEFMMIFISLLFAAGLKLRYFAGAGIAALIVSPIIWYKVLGSRQTDRILALFNPSAYASNKAYQQIQSRNAIGSGQLWGFGLFKGPITQSANKYSLPERYNDMIFAVVGEELGFVGCMLLVILLLVLVLRILYISKISKDILGSYLCIGVFSAFLFQIIANIGMCLFLMPVIGLTLPFVSSGGTSILSCFLAVGLVLSVYLNRKTGLFAKNGTV